MTVDDIDEWRQVADQPHLLVLKCTQNDVYQAVSVHGGSLIVGRYSKLRLHAAVCDVSQFHVRFEWDQKARKWKVRDLNSSNGSKLNGKKVRADQKMALKNGDTVVLANTMTLSVEIVPFSSKDVTTRDALFHYANIARDQIQGETEDKYASLVEEYENLDADFEDLLQAV